MKQARAEPAPGYARLDLGGLDDQLKVLAGTERTVRRLDAIRAAALAFTSCYSGGR